MKKLFRYEMIKTRFSKFIILGITAVLEILFLLGLATSDEKLQSVGMVLLVLIAVASILWIGIQSVVTLHKDMNTRQSYMLFMTPNNCYKILGAKYLENGLSILLSGLFFGVLGALDLTLLFNHYHQLDQLLEMLKEILSIFTKSISLDPASIISFLVYLLFDWLFTVSLAYLAVIVCTALLNGKKGNLFLSFLLFLGLDILFSILFAKIFPSEVANGTMIASFLPRAGLCLVITVAIYWINARIMEKYLSV